MCFKKIQSRRVFGRRAEPRIGRMASRLRGDLPGTVPVFHSSTIRIPEGGERLRNGLCQCRGYPEIVGPPPRGCLSRDLTLSDTRAVRRAGGDAAEAVSLGTLDFPSMAAERQRKGHFHFVHHVGRSPRGRRLAEAVTHGSPGAVRESKRHDVRSGCRPRSLGTPFAIQELSDPFCGGEDVCLGI